MIRAGECVPSRQRRLFMGAKKPHGSPREASSLHSLCVEGSLNLI